MRWPLVPSGGAGLWALGPRGSHVAAADLVDSSVCRRADSIWYVAACFGAWPPTILAFYHVYIFYCAYLAEDRTLAKSLETALTGAPLCRPFAPTAHAPLGAFQRIAPATVYYETLSFRPLFSWPSPDPSLTHFVSLFCFPSRHYSTVLALTLDSPVRPLAL